ncbi:MAG: hypothetical protein HYS09_04310 [Chloroflexi bacterium]|nr:hypothetical protein [Chloroflexota bacterium]
MRKSRLAEIETSLGETEELIARREEIAQRKEALRRLHDEQKVVNFEVDEIRTKASGIEKKLYGGSVRNPKELEDLQQDLEAIRRQLARPEDELLNLMVQVDEAEQALREAEADLGILEAGWKEEQAALRQEKEQLLAEVADLEEKRTRQSNPVQPQVLSLYDLLRERRQGKAVAKAERGMCQGCRITLPVSVLQKARAGAGLVQCVSCERILYVS